MPLYGTNGSAEPSLHNATETAGIGAEETEAVIARLRSALKAIQHAELERLYDRLPMLNTQSRQEIHRFSDQLVATMLDPPLKALSEKSGCSPPSALLDSLQRLFQLHESTAPQSSIERPNGFTE